MHSMSILFNQMPLHPYLQHTCDPHAVSFEKVGRFDQGDFDNVTDFERVPV